MNIENLNISKDVYQQMKMCMPQSGGKSATWKDGKDKQGCLGTLMKVLFGTQNRAVVIMTMMLSSIYIYIHDFGVRRS